MGYSHIDAASESIKSGNDTCQNWAVLIKFDCVAKSGYWPDLFLNLTIMPLRLDMCRLIKFSKMSLS